MMYFFLYGQKQPIGWGKMKQHLFKMNIFTYQFLEKKQKSSMYLTKGVFLNLVGSFLRSLSLPKEQEILFFTWNF